MLSTIAKVILQILAVGLAILVNYLDYLWHDKRTRRFKLGRRTLFMMSFVFLIGSVLVTVNDEYTKRLEAQEAAKREASLERQLNKLREQNDGLQKGISILSDKSSNIIDEQRSSVVSLLEEQRKVGVDTAEKIEGATDLLDSRVNQSIDLLHLSTTEIGRAINPVSELKVSFIFYIPLNSSTFSNYREQLNKAVDKILALPSQPKFDDHSILSTGMEISSSDLSDWPRNVRWLRINPDSPYFPGRDSQGVLHLALDYVQADINLFRADTDIRGYFNNTVEPDFAFKVRGALDNSFSKDPDYNAPVALNYDVKRKQLLIWGDDIVTDPRKWNKTGRLTAIPDLSGAQMLVSFASFMLSADPQVHEILRTVEIESIAIEVSGGRRFQFWRSQMKRYTNKHGYPYFAWKFPTLK